MEEWVTKVWLCPSIRPSILPANSESYKLTNINVIILWLCNFPLKKTAFVHFLHCLTLLPSSIHPTHSPPSPYLMTAAPPTPLEMTGDSPLPTSCLHAVSTSIYSILYLCIPIMYTSYPYDYTTCVDTILMCVQVRLTLCEHAILICMWNVCTHHTHVWTYRSYSNIIHTFCYSSVYISYMFILLVCTRHSGVCTF